jgi:hypothetical protein
MARRTSRQGWRGWADRNQGPLALGAILVPSLGLLIAAVVYIVNINDKANSTSRNVDAVKTDVETLRGDVEDINSRLTRIETLLGVLQGDVPAIQERLRVGGPPGGSSSSSGSAPPPPPASPVVYVALSPGAGAYSWFSGGVWKGVDVHADVGDRVEQLHPFDLVQGLVALAERRDEVLVRTALDHLLRRINAYLVRWLRRKYQRLRPTKKALACWQRITRQQPSLFAHWAWMAAYW